MNCMVMHVWTRMNAAQKCTTGLRIFVRRLEQMSAINYLRIPQFDEVILTSCNEKRWMANMDIRYGRRQTRAVIYISCVCTYKAVGARGLEL